MREQSSVEQGDGVGSSVAWKVGGLLALILAAVYFPILFAGKTLCYRDFGVMGIPTAMYHRAALWNGDLPLWNPYSNCGVPFLAQWGTMVLYPFSLIYVLLPMPWSLNFFCVFHLWLGGMGMYWLARKWTGEEWPAALAGVAFLCMGLTQATLSWANYTAGLAFFPWVIHFVENAWSAPREHAPRALFKAVLVSAMQLLTGTPELAIFTWGIVTLLWFQEMAAERTRAGTLLWRHALMIAGSAGLCAAQLLPFLDLLQHSQRTPGFAVEKWALPIWGWANFVLPRFHTFSTPEGTVFQYGQEFLSSTYIGAPLLLLAAFSFRSSNRRVVTLACLSAVAAALALGSAGGLYSVAVKTLPFLRVARYPVKFLFLLSFTIPMLAAFGYRELSRMKCRTAALSLALGCAVATLSIALLIWVNHAHPFPYDRWPEFKSNSSARALVLLLFVGVLYASKRQTSCSPCLASAAIGLLAIDGFSHLRNQNPTVAASLFEKGLWEQTQKGTRPEPGSGRVFITPEAERKFLHSSLADLGNNLLGQRLAVWSHLNLIDRIPKVNGSATLQMRDEALVQNALYSGTNSALAGWLNFLCVTLETSSNSVVEWQARNTAMPWVTGGQQPVQSDARILNDLFDFKANVALASGLPAWEKVTNQTVEISQVRASSSEITFLARSSGPSVAVIPESWHPAWKAEVLKTGGRSEEVPVLKANLAFQAVPIPAGESRVRVYYKDNFFRVGAALSILTLVAGGYSCRKK